MGPNTLERFETAQELFDFISKKMPLQEPGILREDEYWALTAYILNRQGVLAKELQVGTTTASRIPIHPERVQPSQISSEMLSSWILPLGVLVVGVFFAAGALVVLFWRSRQARKE